MKKNRQRKPRNESLHDILVHVKPGRHKTDKRDKSKRAKDKERRDTAEYY